MTVGMLDLSAQSAILCLCSEAGATERPLMEICLRGISGRAELDAHSLSWQIEAQLALSVFSASRSGWEPVLEPWRFHSTGVSPVHR